MLKNIEILSCADIPRMVLERAYWNGVIKKAYLKGGIETKIPDESNSEFDVYKVSKNKKKRGDYIIREIWSENEELINESLNCMFLSMPIHDLAKILSTITENKVDDQGYHLCNIVWDSNNIKGLTGDPDIVFCSEDKTNIILIEFKIAAKKGNGKFSLQQLVKYNVLKQLLEQHGKHVSFFVLSPFQEFIDCVEHSEQDWYQRSDNLYEFLPEKASGNKPSNLTNKKFNNTPIADFEIYKEYILSECDKKGVIVKPFDFQKFGYISFQTLRDALIEKAPHLVEAFTSIDKYSSRSIKK
jgi:hypothetical protein